MSSNPETTRKGVSALDFFCIGFGAIVGVGWAVSINGWISGSGGPVPASLGYIMCLVIMIPVALCYCELCPMLPVAGGGAAYAYRAFGEKISVLSGWAAFGAFVAIIPWEAIQICDVASYLIPQLKAGGPMYELGGEGVYIGQIILGTIFTLILLAVNWRGMSTSAMLQRVLCIILVGAGIMGAIVSLTSFSPDHLEPIYKNMGDAGHNGIFGGMLAILASAPFFLAGFETIPQGVEDAGGDIKSVGKTVVLSVGLACIFYAILLFSFGGAQPWQEFLQYDRPAAANLMTVIYPNAAGQTFRIIILVGAIAGLFTTWNGFMAASPRLLMSMARSNMVPKVFAKENPKTGVPTNALIACTVLSLVGPFMGAGLIGDLTSFSSAGFVLSWGITAACVVKLRSKEPNLERPYRLPGGKAMAIFAALAMAVVFVLLFIPSAPAFMGKIGMITFVGWMIIGLILYVASAGERNKLTPQERYDHMFANMK